MEIAINYDTFDDYDIVFFQKEPKSTNPYHYTCSNAMEKKTTFETDDTSFNGSNIEPIVDEVEKASLMQELVKSQFLKEQIEKDKQIEQEQEQELEFTCFPEDLMIPHIDSSNEQVSYSSSQDRSSLETEENKMLLNNLISLAKEQSSCRYLQQKINNEPRLASQMFYHKIIANINDLIVHPFGNYLIQNFLTHITDSNINEILLLLSHNFFFVASNFYGTRVIQKMIECIKTTYPTTTNLLNLIKKDFPQMLNDINASHIIIKLLDLKEMYITNAIYEMINTNLLQVSMNKHGCCEIQKILEKDTSAYAESIINNIINNSLQLITHQYGNYTIQYILQLRNPVYTFRLIRFLVPSFMQLCLQKYSSTVIEKCFELCDEGTRNILYQFIANQSIMKALICDKFGNYVIQKAIDVADPGTMRIYLLTIIAPMMNEIKKENFGRQLYTKLCTKYPSFQEMINNCKQ